MKKTVLIILLVLNPFLLIGAESLKDSELQIIPADTSLILQTSDVNLATRIFKFLFSNSMPSQRDKTNDQIKSFLDKTGIDVLNDDSLSAAGIDVTRKMFFTWSYTDNQRNELVYLPIADEKKLYQQLMKNTRNESQTDGAESKVSSIVYQKYRISNLYSSLNYVVMDNFLIISRSTDRLKTVIDLKNSSEKKGILGSDAFEDFYRNAKNKSAYLWCDNRAVNDIYRIVFPVETSEIASADETETEDEKDQDAKSREDFLKQVNVQNISGIEYLGVELMKTPAGIDLDFSFKMNEKNATSKQLLDLLTCGNVDKSGFMPDAAIYTFVSLDIKKLNQIADTNRTFNQTGAVNRYKQLRFLLDKGMGINLNEDFLPEFKGYFILLQRPELQNPRKNDFLFYIPLENEKSAAKMYKKMAGQLKEFFKDSGAFDEDKIDGTNAITIVDEKGGKIYLAAYKNSLIVGNSSEFIRRGMSGLVDEPKNISESISDTDDKTFLVFRVDMQTAKSFKASLALWSIKNNLNISDFIYKLNLVQVIGKKDNSIVKLKTKFNYFDLAFPVLPATVPNNPDENGGKQ